MMYKIKIIINRIKRYLVGKKGIYGNIGKKNHFSKGVIIYENALIGNNNYFSPYVLINNATIGNYCSVGPGSKIGLADHDLYAISTFPAVNNGTERMQLFDNSNPTVIGSDVWIGANAVIKSGLKINTGAVIGAGSVVTKDLPSYSIAAGVPAKIIGYRFEENIISKIINSKWYEKNLKDAKKNVELLYKEIKE